MIRKPIYRAIISFLSILMCVPSSHGVPAKPGAIKTKTSDGEIIEIYKHGDEHFHYMTDKDGNVIVKDTVGDICYAVKSECGIPVSSGIRYSRTKKPIATLRSTDIIAPSLGKASRVAPESVELPFRSEGELRTIIILVQYQDVKFTVDDIRKETDRLLNEKGYSKGGATGSAKDYFEYSSNGKFSPTFDVYGPVTLSQNRAYYGGNDRFGNDVRAHEMVSEGVRLLDDEVDFSEYDIDGDGEVENVYVVYAGCGESDTDIEESVWPHAYRLEYAGISDCYLDGVRINSYACSPELEGTTRKLNGIGTLCHEFSHVLGLPDLYQTGSLPALDGAPGYFSVMSYGTYNDNGRTPPAYTAWERYVMGWLEPTVLTDSRDVAMKCIDEEGYDDCYLIRSPYDNEYWILENRQPLGWDKPLGVKNINAHGLLVWHIDYDHRDWFNNSLNNNPSHPRVDIVEAHGNALNTPWQAPFPGTTKKTEWTDVVTWKKEKQPYSLTEIKEQGTLIQFRFNVESSSIEGVVVDDTDVPVEYFNLQGERVVDPSGTPGVYILRQGSVTKKVMIN